MKDIMDALSIGGLESPTVIGTDSAALPSVFDVSGLALATIGAVCAERAAMDGHTAPIEIDRRLASEWLTFLLEPQEWALPPVWDDVAGVYAAKNGHIRLHTNAPHHKIAALSVLDCPSDRKAVAGHVAEWDEEDLEAAIVAAGGCAAALRSREAWAAHEQGRAVASEPLIAWQEPTKGPPLNKPLSDIRVLDLTRVLAGPVATRTLSGFGAQVLRIDPPGWAEAICEPEVTWGKRLATLDLKSAAGREQLITLMKRADILVHGYRANALEDLGLGADRRRAINPSMIDLSLNAYGWAGPWRNRRGFDSLVQMSCGIADAGMRAAAADGPVPLPMQALDYGTGYLLAAAALRALRIRSQSGVVMGARLSLARTAHSLMQTTGPGLDAPRQARRDGDFVPAQTHWGPGQRLRWPGPTPMRWDLPARPFHADPPRWSQ